MRLASESVVLGIVDGLHDAGAALVRGGRILAAANEERFTRVKLQGGWPKRSIAAVLATAGLEVGAVDAVAVGGKATPTLATRVFRPLQRMYGPSLGICFDRPWHPVDRIGDLVRYRLSLTRARSDQGLGKAEGRMAASWLRRALPRGLKERELTFVDHHVAHAESAWRTSGDGSWLVVTADAHGDGRSLTVHRAVPGRPLELLHEIGVKQSVGAFYSYVTKRLGFRPGRHEGKVLGLAARGDRTAVAMRYPFRWEGGTLRYDGSWGLVAMKRLRVLEDLRREDVAAWLQHGTESVLVPAIEGWLRETGLRQLALAGGVFANVTVNGLLAGLPEVERLHVFPHMGDGGLAAGAALHVSDQPPVALPTALLGPTPSDAEIAQAAERAGGSRDASGNPDATLARALAQGQPCVRYVGAMEFGPRALGHRSVLAPVDDPAITDTLNAALRREEFMPFAPLLRHEDGARAFATFDVAEAATRFMTVALPATPWFRERCPAAVHLDGTARPQTVRAEEDPELHALLAQVAEATGRPAIINTSFNLHEEPIAHSPADAVRAFRQSGLPLMRLGSYLLRNPDSVWKPRDG